MECCYQGEWTDLFILLMAGLRKRGRGGGA